MKMKAFAFAMLLGGVAYSQSQTYQLEADSLLNLLSKQEEDTNKVRSLVLLQELKKDQPNKAIYYAKEAAGLAKKLQFDKGFIESQLALGALFYSQNSPDSALVAFEEVLTLTEESSYKEGLLPALTGKGKALKSKRMWDEAIAQHLKCIELADLNDGDSAIVATNYNLLGNIYLHQHRYEKALSFYQKGAELLPNLSRTKSAVLLNMGIIQRRIENFDGAVVYYLEGLEIAKQLDDKNLIAHSYQKIAAIKRLQKDYAEAMKYYRLALTQFEGIGNKSMIGSLHSNLGDVFFGMEDFDASIIEYELSLPFLIEVDDKVSQCYSLSGMGMAYSRLNKFSRAEEYLRQAKNLSADLGIRLVTAEATLALSELYAKQRNFEKAYSYHVEYSSLNDSIFDETKSEQIAEMEAKYETSQKQREIELLNAQNQINELKIAQRGNQRNILLIAVVAFMGLAFVLYNRYKIRTQANKKLQELDHLKSRFFTNISHEFRTPLTLILGPLESKLANTDSLEEREQLLLMKRNADRLLELINQLLDLSKLEAGKMNLSVSKGDFHTFLSATISSFDSLGEQKGIDLAIDIPAQPLNIPFDKEKCDQIFFNLLSNAFKFTPTGGSISVSVGTEGEMVKVLVQDSGPGIPAQELDNIFKRFHQLTDAKNHQHGTGIGLALVKELVTLHHGEVSVSSSIDEGTCFEVKLPITSKSYENVEFLERWESASSLPITEISTPIGSDHQEENLDAQYVLIVEDNADVRTFISSILAPTYKLLLASNGREGVDLAKKHVPDLIVSDLMMPEMDGMELCEIIRKDEKTSHIPVVLLTAKADQQSKVEGLETGADDYLIKPFDEKELKVRVANLIEQRAKLRQRFERQVTLEPTQIAITPPDEAFVTKALAVVEENINNFEFTVELFQKEMAMSRMQLHRKLKALISCSASEFIRIQRLKRAAQILEIGGVSVSEAAYKSGFNNLSYFAKCFKEEFGVSPSDYPS